MSKSGSAGVEASLKALSVATLKFWGERVEDAYDLVLVVIACVSVFINDC